MGVGMMKHRALLTEMGQAGEKNGVAAQGLVRKMEEGYG